METLYLLLGVALLLLAVTDALWTTLWVDGSSGPLASRLTTVLWRLIRALSPGRNHRRLSLAGPVILATIAMTWVLLIWVGWTLIFVSHEGALTDSRDSTPPDWVGRLYFVAYAMFTMGNGDFKPQGSVWQVLTSLTTASGMLLITLIVSYVLSVLSAVVKRRSLASAITGLADSAEGLVVLAWNGRDLSAMNSTLRGLASQLDTVTQQHLAYPILHYYHSAKPDTASAPGLAILDDALTLMQHGVPGEFRPDPVALRSARASVQSYLSSLNSAFISPADEAPPPPDLGRLRAAGVPTVTDAEFARAVEELRERRRKVLGLMRNDAWRWPPLEEVRS